MNYGINMPKIKITLPDSSVKKFEKGVTPGKIAKSIGKGLAEGALAAKVNDQLVDLDRPITEDAKVKILTFKDEEGLEVFRHSSAHLLAQAVTELFPEAKPTIGPVVEEGFYYDFDIKKPFHPDDLKKIEQRMAEIVKKDLKLKRSELTKNDAKSLFRNNHYKIEFIDEFGDVTVYKQGDFVDLCRGPHVPSTGKIKAFRLTKIAGAYWRGDAKNQQLQRIYGISFPDKKQLDKHFKLKEEAEKRNHRKIGKELDLFSFDEESGQGFVFWHHKGNIIREALMQYCRKELTKAGYKEVVTPQILKKDLWVQSGHWDHYKEHMYFTRIDDQDYAFKPMNCPGTLLVYKKAYHSYKELPLRMAEFGLVHRHELSGVLSGLFRLRAFTQDDAHHFVSPEILKDELVMLIEFTDKVYKLFGFDYRIELSTMPEKSMLTKEVKEKSENALKKALDEKGIKYTINQGEGAFYGPKIDFHLKDCIGRTWQCGTIQVDFSMPEKFDLHYIGKDGQKHRPIMIHRTIYGSIERFIGVLIEHYAGKFPMWISPVQARVITVSEKVSDYAQKVFKKLEEKDIRVELDNRTESVSYKIREAQLQKINYMLVVGEKEEKKGAVNVRTRENKVLGTMKADEFLKKALKEIKNKE